MSDELWKGFRNLHLPEHHCMWKVREDAIEPLPLLKWYFRDYGFYTEESSIGSVEMTPWYGMPNHVISFLKHLEYGACVKGYKPIPNQTSATL